MSVIVLIVLGSIAGIVVRTMVNHSLVLAAVLVVASSSWAGPSSAGAGAAVGAGTGYGAGKGAMIGTGVGAVAGAIYDITRHEKEDD